MGSVAYVFTAYYFAFTALLLHLQVPLSYRGVVEADPYGQLWQFVYYSVVTISTLGYGDIVPNSPTTQVLAILEVGLGQFFMLFLFGAFVSFHIARITSESEPANSAAPTDQKAPLPGR